MCLQIASRLLCRRNVLATIRRPPTSEITKLRRFSSKQKTPVTEVHTKYSRDRHSKGNASGFGLVFGLGVGMGAASCVIMAKCEEQEEDSRDFLLSAPAE